MFLTRAMCRRLAWLAIATLCSGGAQAIGLRRASGDLVIGRPLLITIPLESDSANPVDSACFRLLPPAFVTESEYVLRDAALQVEVTGGKSRLVILSRSAWTHPVVEFRVAAVCSGMGVVRDYTLLVEMPTEHNVPQQRVVTEPKRSAPLPAPAIPADTESVTLDGATNLNALARQRYPDNRALRDTFRKMLGESNPELFSGKDQIGSIPLGAGTVLRIPRNLPPHQAPAVAVAAPRSPVASTEKKVSTPKSDRLVIGGNPGNAPKPGTELAAMIERLERMSEDQGRTQVKMSDNLDALELAMTVLAKNVLQMEDRMLKLSEERDKAEEARLAALAKLADERAKFGFLEVLMLILAGGGVGAGLLFYFDRLSPRRLHEGGDLKPAAPPPEPVLDAAPLPVPETVSFEGSPFDNLAEAADNARFADFVATKHARVTLSPVAPVHQEPPHRPTTQRSQPDTVKKVVATAAVQVLPAIAEPAVAVPVEVHVIEFSLGDDDAQQRVVGGEDVLNKSGLSLPELDIHFDPVLPSEIAATVDNGDDTLPVIALDMGETLGDRLATVSSAPDVFELEDLKRVAHHASECVPVTVEPAKASAGEVAMELAEIMASMGLSKGAAEVLAEVIEENPNDSTDLWVRFLDFYHKEDLRDEMADAFAVLKGNFNVDVTSWQDSSANSASLLDYRHIIEALVKLWNTDDCDAYLMMLLADNRGGTRAGFPRSIVEEILLLQRIFRDKALH